ncbi:MAG: dipeptidase, partial [Gammaproteobacteria bacterium]|nr:dipeptidase [Gammaproteobacteria bacterium]
MQASPMTTTPGSHMIRRSWIGLSKTCLLITLLWSGEVCFAADTSQIARQLAHEAIIVDTHIDTPYRLHKKMADISQATETGKFDLPRARDGGLDVIFMSIYTPANLETQQPKGAAREHANNLMALTRRIAAEHPDAFAMATCVSDIYRNKEKGLVSFAMGMENGSPIEGELSNLDTYRIQGIRYITLAHSKSNHVSDSSYDENEPWEGLSPFGRKVVPSMNTRGIMIDISHLSDRAAWQVLKLSKAPVIASHSSLRHFVPGFHRNMTDDMFRALAKNGGVLQINFGSGFVTAKAREWTNNRTRALKDYKVNLQLADDAPEIQSFLKQYALDNPYPFARLSDVLDHFDRAVDLAGVDYVGVGSDFDGVGDTLPVGLNDVSAYPNLIRGLLERGYNKNDIFKLLGGNLLRVWEAVEAHATA